MNYNYIKMIAGFLLAYNAGWFCLTAFIADDKMEFLARMAIATLAAGFLFIGTRKND